MNNNEETHKIAGTLDLGRYAVPLDRELTAGKREREQQARVDNYFVKLPLRLLALPFHRPITKVLAFLWREAALQRSHTVRASYQRAKRLVSLNCSRKTFYRALDQLDAAGVLTKTHVNGRAIEVRIHDFKGGVFTPKTDAAGLRPAPV